MGGVFVVPHFEPIGALLSELGSAVGVDEPDSVAAHYRGVRGITDLLGTQTVDEADLDVWGAYDGAYFASLGVSPSDMERALQARRAQRSNGGAHIWNQPLAANIEAFRLISASRPVAILTNNDGTAIQQCINLELCQIGAGPLVSVPAIVDSGLLGIAKPDPAIFDPVIESLGTDRVRTLYVGDTVHADVLGATRAGLRVLQLDPLNLHDDHDHWRLPDVAALAHYLQHG